ncbi:MAG: hypothetical protein ACRD0G_03305 [Acidimicrobiales bacterium]
MASHTDAFALASRPRVGRRRLTEEIGRRGGLSAVLFRTGLVLLLVGLLAVVASTTGFSTINAWPVYLLAAGSLGFVSGIGLVAAATAIEQAR